MAIKQITTLATDQGIGQDPPAGSDVILKEKANGQPSWCFISQLLPTGGATGHVLKKQSGLDFDLGWEAETGGGGGGGGLQASDIASGTITPRSGSVNFSGGLTGYVWTVQSDGSAAFQEPSGGGGGGTGDADPSRVTSSTFPFTLTDAMRAHLQVDVFSHATNVDFEVPANADDQSRWIIKAEHTGCTVSVAGDSGSVNGTPGGNARIIQNSAAIVYVRSNPGLAPVVEVQGGVIIAPQSTGAKTYTNDDHMKDLRITTGDQTFSAAANYREGFAVNLFNDSGASRNVVGIDATHVLPANGVVTVKRWGTGLRAFGSGGTTVLDAA